MTDLWSILAGISFASGLNIYATVLALGLLHRWDIVSLPGQLSVVSSTPVLAGAAVLYTVEFIADKVPYIDSFWDLIHSVIRPAGAAVLAYSALGGVSPEWQLLAALIGGGVALTSHTAKASTRAAVNLSPEPFSNWALSLMEDGIAFALVWLSAAHPLIALVLLSVLIAVAVWIVVTFSRLIRRVWPFSPARKA